MDESYYTARLVITEGCEDRLDMTITCQNAQQLLRAKDTIADQMNTYIAEFAMQSNLIRKPSTRNRMPLRFRQSFRSRPKRQSSRSRKNLPSRSRPKLHPMSQRKAPPHDDALDAVCYRPDLASFKLAPTETPKKAAKPEGAKGLMRLRCPKCGDEFVAFTKDYRTEWTCKECGAKFSLENTALFEYDCSCGRHTYRQTNIESPDFSYPCGDCGKETTLKWNPKAKKYME